MSKEFSIQDFALIKAHVDKIAVLQEHTNKSNSFIWFVLRTLFDMDDDSIHESITDTVYIGNHSGMDRGLDAIVINEDTEIKEIHFFNFKYTEDVEKSKNNNFPSNEIDKVTSAMDDIFQLNLSGYNSCNHALKDKINEVLEIIQGEPSGYKCYIHFSSNYFKGLVSNEYERIVDKFSRYKNIKIIQDTLETLSVTLLGQSRMEISGKIQYSQDDGFIRTDGNSRALVFSINAISLLSLVSSSESIRSDPNFDDLGKLKEAGIIEDAFEMNIRKYQKNRNKINKNIIGTVISEERQKVFYYNNGITMICDKFEYGDTKNTVLTVKNLQIVNGCQTVHSLFDALNNDPEKLKNVDLLCRLYEINNKETYAKIAEYTNSQTPVTGRDLRSNDEIQRKLEESFNAHGYIYERKRIYHKSSDDLSRVIDNEKVGQLLMAFNNEMPGEAKNKKSLIFGKEYDNIFVDSLTASTILEIFDLYNMIERKRKQMEARIKKDEQKYGVYYFITYASYYILYVISKIKKSKNLSQEELKDSFGIYYNKTVNMFKKYLESQKKELGERFSASHIFKNRGLKKFIDKNEIKLMIS